MAASPPRRRSGGPEWLRQFNDRMTATVRAFVVANTVIYLFYLLARNSRRFIQDHLALGPRFFAGEIWQPITSLFVHISFLGFVFGFVGLWYVGSAVERLRGRRRFLGLFFLSGVLTNLTIAGAWLLWHRGPIPFNDGSTFVVVTLFLAFTRGYGRQLVQFWPTNLAIQARYMALIMVGLAVAVYATQDPQLLPALAVAVVIGYFGAAPGGMNQLKSFIANARDAAKVRRLRRRFGVIDGGDRPSKKYVN